MDTSIYSLIALLVGYILGNAQVYIFNHIPGSWLVDYDEEPDAELMHPTRQRIKSVPWKYIFSMFYMVTGIYLVRIAPLYAFASLAAIWLLMLMAIADNKYMVVPDELQSMLLVTAFGFLPYHARGVMDILWGSGIAFVVMGLLMLFTKIVYKEVGIGGADVKLFLSLGLIGASDGIIIIFMLSSIFAALHFIILMILKKLKRDDKMPFVPYITLASIIYIVIIHNLIYDAVASFSFAAIFG